MTEVDVMKFFQRWNDALATGNPDAVTGLYAEDAILLPTVSNQVRHNHEEIRDYFVNFLAKKPEGVIEEANIRFLADGLAINSGVYTFTFGDQSTVTARFTYLYRKIDGHWKIVEHHSSAMPEVTAAAGRESAAA
ncbi:SgcJ/EcaC family oxidoreductase [Congregibacter variabilis]|uniref:SgcJ/EcaC family oxidoreductase n=1 Tax=Congregibacter variabilis TaxID=3081200 RepID=A0ABZ0I1H6_9GAMM|nr:SgcJ/EcaC family oxidoreductase [Congregibacter sp. IMCC43200]